MEELTSKLDVQLKLLKLTQGKTKGIVEKANSEGIERHREALRAIVKKVESIKTQIEQAKLESGIQVDELAEWSPGVETQQATADEEITYLSEKLIEINYKASLEAKKCEEELAERDRDKQLQFERAQFEQKLEFEMKIEEARKNQVVASPAPGKSAKLPKLVISKFSGELTDWPRFWNQFEAEIDLSEVAAVTKFSYLKELVNPKVKTAIDGLPFTTEGYQRAKNILKSKYGQMSEIVNAYVQNIMALPMITGSHPKKIHEFYKKGQTSFQVIGVDFVGPLRYRKKPKTEGKAYILLYACSLTRAMYVDLVQNLETTEFIRSLKCFIALRGRPQRIYSDNGKTFVSASKWIQQVMKDERIHGFLTQQGIEWKFNLSRAPWWGGQFERLIGLVKGSLYKSVGNGLLSWKELQEVLLDVEVALNNRPLDYVEDDIKLPILTPSSLLHMQPNTLPELEPNRIQDYDLRKQAKYLGKCKDAVWSRWTREYLRGLWERHCLKHKGDSTYPAEGEVVTIKSDEKNRARWKMGVVIDVITGQDGVVRGAKLRTPKSVIERPVQHLYPLELSCDMRAAPAPLNTTVAAFRPQRNAAVATRARIQELAQMDDEN
ncbi:uncharacterized protein LOC122960562 [Acropora millepora]|uniref:uncharacterized protein LOC122960562 n=1 Tax=Acropora millepora TaxID=45264 RepID=UPI001CF37FC7|nr:uncharacterized protein LOC122960562 [Acropora millepora]